MARFGIYGDDVDKIMDEFEAFRKLNRTHLLWALNSSINSLEQMKQYLEGKGDADNSDQAKVAGDDTAQ